MLEVISARAAFDAGLKRYFTGKPCGNGHLAERMISNGSCVQCLADRRKLARSDAYERVKAWRLSNPGARASEAEKYRKAHPDAVKRRQKKYCDANRELRAGKTAAWRGRMRATNPEGEKARLAKWAQRAREKRAREAGRSKPTCCEICGRSDLRIVWDHCHASGRFRAGFAQPAIRRWALLATESARSKSSSTTWRITMAKLTAMTRSRLAAGVFGLPQQRKYPTDTKGRAVAAKARAAQQVKAGNLSAAEEARIDAKANRKLYGSSKAPKGRK